MSEEVLTDDEKEALTDGVIAGDVAIRDGDETPCDDVRNFEIPPRNVIVRFSYPRLASVNGKMALRFGGRATSLLNAKVDVFSAALQVTNWATFTEQNADLALLVQFTAAPLDGPAVVYFPAATVREIVEVFFGSSEDAPPRHAIEGFTPGEINVLKIFCNELYLALRESWSAFLELQPETVTAIASTDVAEIIESSAGVIVSTFSIRMRAGEQVFHVVWPETTLAPLLPVFEGAKGERDAAEDQRWGQVITARVPDAPVEITSEIGSADLSLRDVAALKPGDVIDIENPRQGTVYAKGVAVLQGRFGVHEGVYAMEAMNWVTQQ